MKKYGKHIALLIICLPAVLPMMTVSTAEATLGGDFLFAWGGILYSSNNHYHYPSGVAVDGLGNVYVVDSGNDRIQVLDGEAAFIREWGSHGTGDGEFYSPRGIAVDGLGNVYVVDSGNDRIQVFDGEGVFIRKWGSGGEGDGQFSDPSGIAVDGLGNVYVVDSGNDRIRVFDGEGAFIREWGSYGAGDGELYSPRGIAVDGLGNVYVGDSGNDRIQVFDGEGAFIRKWGSGGEGDGQFNDQSGIAVDGLGNVYVVDSGNDRIQVFDGEGAFIRKWGSHGTGDGEFYSPRGIAVNGFGNVYVVDSGNGRIQVFEGLDTTPPTITASIDPSPNANGLHNEDVTVTFTCTDAASGIASCTQPIVVTTEGAGQVITGTATDKAGNTATTSVTLNIDKTDPAITATVDPPANANGWHNTDVTVSFTCTDAASGIAECPQPIVVTAEGAGQVITGTATDKAGNAATTSVTLNIDKTSPAADISVIPGLLWPPNHKKVDVAVNGGANDPTSGVATIEITVQDEYGTVEPSVSGFNTAIPLEAWRDGGDKDGRHYTITAAITDNAGNVTTVSTEAVVPHDMRGKK